MSLLIADNPIGQDAFTMILLFLENLARKNEPRGFPRGGLDGWGFGVLRMLRSSRIASQDKKQSRSMPGKRVTQIEKTPCGYLA
jgi:hypothetical protein